MFRPASRLATLPPPATIAMSARARILAEEGRHVISLALGQPDFPSPEAALEGAIAEVRAGHTGYPPIAGQKPLLEAVAEKFRRDNGLDLPLSQIMVANGGKQLIFNAFMASLEEGDEVIVPSPYWVSYPLIAKLFGGRAVPVPCSQAHNFRLRAEDLRGGITPRTRWVVLNFPNNPTGAILERDDLEAIADVLRQFPDILVMCDEIYEHLTFDGRKHLSLTQIAPDLAGRILVINGVSKAYAMTGWRVGFACGPEDLIGAMVSIQGNSTSGICTLAQGGATAVLRGDNRLVETMRQTYERRRNEVVAALRQIEGMTCALPDGAFYAYPDITALLGRKTPAGRLLKDDVAFTAALLEEVFLAVVPGSAFGCGGHMRLSFAASDKDLAEACRRLAQFVAGLTP